MRMDLFKILIFEIFSQKVEVELRTSYSFANCSPFQHMITSFSSYEFYPFQAIRKNPHLKKIDILERLMH